MNSISGLGMISTWLNITINNTNGLLKAAAPNVAPGPILALDADRNYGWYYGRTGANAFIFAYDDGAADVYERVRLIKVGEIGTKVGNYTILNRGFIE